jgi:hypothetical protein
MVRIQGNNACEEEFEIVSVSKILISLLPADAEFSPIT